MARSRERISGGVALNIPVKDDETWSLSSKAAPWRLRRRLLESKHPSSVQEIEAKLREANLRRQQFYEFLSSKARPKLTTSPSCSSSQQEDLRQRIEAKLNAAHQKRLSILAKAQMRLARLDELRQAVKTGLEMRFEKERDELGIKVESRVHQAEMKRSGLLEAEKTRARARVLQVQRAAKSVYSQREMERKRIKDQLEDRLQRAKKQRAEHLRQRRCLHGYIRTNSKMMHEQGKEYLSRILARCWSRFVRVSKTTYGLAKVFKALGIDEESIKSMPFEQLALRIESATTIQTTKALVDRLESRFTLSQAATGNPSSLENIDHLLHRVAFPKQRGSTGSATKRRGARTDGSGKEVAQSPVKLPRYPVRVLLCAYMIMGHPDAVSSGKSELEIALAESTANFIQEFELLIKILLDGPSQTAKDKTASAIPNRKTFRSQLEAFDKVWCSYLYCFVAWKVNDAKVLEEDIVKAGCQLELSMMQTCKLTPEGDDGGLTHDMKAIQKQVMEDQKLLRAKVQHLSGSAGLEHMECALFDIRSQFSEAKEYGSPLASPIAYISSTCPPGSSDGSSVSVPVEISYLADGGERSSHVVGSLFEKDDSSPSKEVGSTTSKSNIDGHLSSGEMLVGENELLVNEIVHGHGHGFADSFDVSDEDQNSLKAKARETMEKAFWAGVMDSIKQNEPDFSWVLKLMKEVKDELCEMSPQSWRQEIVETIDISILSQVLSSGALDMDYFGKILEFAIVTLWKLSAPANDDEMKSTHNKLLKELGEMAQAGDKSKSSFALLMIKGLRFVLEQIQTLKREISKARMRIVEPLIKGPAGLEYLKKSFLNRYGPPVDAPTSLPLTRQWLSSVRMDAEQEWDEYTDSLSTMTASNARFSQGLLPTTLRTGCSTPMASRTGFPSTATGTERPECRGERVDLLVRLGLLKLVSEVGGLTLEALPETLKLNLSKMRTVQSQLQKIIVISTSMLVLQQTLLSEKLVTSSVNMENIVSKCAKQLSELLDHVEDVGLSEIIEAISGLLEGGYHLLDTEKFQAMKQVIANMLAKSLQAGDAIFTRVSHTVYLASRGAVLGGTGVKGRQLVEAALRRVGAAILIDKVVEAAEVLVVVATVSCSVHGAWYEELLKNM